MAVNISDYSKLASAKGWGMGWPSCDGSKGRLVTVRADRSGVRVTVRSEIARLVDMLMDWTENPNGGNYLFKSGQTGAYNCRPIGGTRTPSNHSWGLALDANWQENPFTTANTHTFPVFVARKWNRFGFAWGGDYRGKKDWMHLEFMGTPQDAAELTALAINEIGGFGSVGGGTANPPPRPNPSGGAARWEDLPSLEYGQRSDEVASFQGFLNWFPFKPVILPILNKDGVYGDLTVSVLRRGQAQVGIRGGDGRNVGNQTKQWSFNAGWRGNNFR